MNDFYTRMTVAHESFGKEEEFGKNWDRKGIKKNSDEISREILDEFAELWKKVEEMEGGERQEIIKGVREQLRGIKIPTVKFGKF